MDLKFDNRFLRELPGDPSRDPFPRQVFKACWSRVKPTAVAQPRLLAHSQEVAELLDLSSEEVASEQFARVFGGNELLPGMDPYAACYGGHQFGNWAGQLGDGRAINLGEVLNARGQRWEIQLKGAGLTPYSRTADGRAVLRSSLREFLCSEAMHHLGVPTTRALSLVETGEAVIRDMMYSGNPLPEPGAVVCRVAPSFIRLGNFEIFAARNDLETLEKLVDFTIDRDFPELEGDDLRSRWFTEVCERTAVLMAHWMRVGFVHGVMNTDNLSILGLTIDYGPYGWIDNFDSSWTPNTTDLPGRRYRFGNQPRVAHWNLLRLANALYDVLPGEESLQHGLDRYVQVYNQETARMTAEKFGLSEPLPEEDPLVEKVYLLMQKAEVDMTLFFRGLADLDPESPNLDSIAEAFYDEEKKEEHRQEFEAWLQEYAQRLSPDPERAERMNRVNPIYVPRNYLAQEAIDLAEEGDNSRLLELLETFRNPYQEQPGREAFAKKRPDWARNRPGCSMLSCSS